MLLLRFNPFSRWELISLIVITASLALAAPNYPQLYKDVVDTQTIKENFEYYTSSAHIAGSPRDNLTANYTMNKFQEYGIPNAWIEATNNVTLSYPVERLLQIIFSNGTVQNATLKENTAIDDTTTDTFNGYSPSGDVRAPVVYVNYGSVEDYAVLDQLNINVAGKIVLARYGKLFRGCKVMLAEMRKAVGVILYSDPNDDGIGRGLPYPDGPWRPLDGVQRGSVEYLSKCPGDPYRNHTDCQNNLPSIPVQPISAADAEPIIKSLTGISLSNTTWTNYWSNQPLYLGGSDDLLVHLKLDMSFQKKPIWNVYAKIEGLEKDRSVIIGAHRDAWVFGGVDPATGSSALLEIARGLGYIYQHGWFPKVSILLASWDGEEYGLLGSTWYGETYKEILQEEAIAYLNLDMAVYGNNFTVDATPSLNAIIKQIATQVAHPNTSTTIAQSWDGHINRLGSGSDYTVFIHHLGIPSANIGFQGDYGVYHSIYDSKDWVEKFGDPTFSLHKAVAEYVGVLAINITSSGILPFNYTDYAHELTVYLNETRQLVSKWNASALVNLSPLEAAINNFTNIAHNVDKEIQKINMADAQSVMSLNGRLINAEKGMLDNDGLPQRPWYKHQIQAPGLYLGYGAEIFPGITQSLNEQNWTQANHYITVVAASITKSAGILIEDEKSYNTVSEDSYTGYQIFMILLTVFIIGSFVAAIWYFRRKRHQFQKNNRYAMMEMDDQM